MASNAQLIANILVDPTDREPYLVYGDWLQSQGDPRGELVIIQAKLQRDAPGDPALLARERELLAHHRDAWLGELAQLGERDFHASWLYGFLHAIRLGPALDQYAHSERDFSPAIATLARLPHNELVQELVIGALDAPEYVMSWAGCIAAIATHGVPPNLARLRFDCGGYWDISSTDLGELSPAYPHLGRLRELAIHLGTMTFGAIELPELRALEVTTGGLTAHNLAELRRARWPKLERLALCIGQSHNDYGCDVELDDLAWIFGAENLAHVRHLGLANSSLADDIARALVGSTILGQLESLDLSRGYLSDTGVAALLDDPRLARLAVLDLSDSYIQDRELIARLERLGPRLVLDGQQDDGGDPQDRYCQISE